MKALFIGGSGIISTACVDLAVVKGIEVSALNRGNRPVPEGCRQLIGDINDVANAQEAIGEEHWDVVVDFLSFLPEDIENRIEIFAGKVGQYIFISSASAYQRPCRNYLITESTPLVNPFWDYSRGKIACEDRLMRELREKEFPVVVVRPSLTFGDTQIPLTMNCWTAPFTGIHRLRTGKPLIIPGDGTSLWTITHNTDFAKGLIGLFANENAIGHAFHITSDEVLTWNQLYEATAVAAGVEDPKFVHIATDFITACMPEYHGSLIGDKTTSSVMNNSKIKQFAPEFQATTRFADGIKQTVAWFDADKSRQIVDHETDAKYDKLVAVYEKGLQAAKAVFRS